MTKHCYADISFIILYLFIFTQRHYQISANQPATFSQFFSRVLSNFCIFCAFLFTNSHVTLLQDTFRLRSTLFVQWTNRLLIETFSRRRYNSEIECFSHEHMSKIQLQQLNAAALYINFISPEWQHDTRKYNIQNIRKVQVIHRQ